MRYVRRHPLTAGVLVVALVASLAAIGWFAATARGAVPDPGVARQILAQIPQGDLLREIEHWQGIVGTTTDPAGQTQARLALGQCCLDVMPGQEKRAGREAAAAMQTAKDADGQARAKLLLADSYKGWRYRQLKLYTQVADDNPGAEWEAWAKIHMAQTLAQHDWGGEGMPSFQCRQAAELLDGVIAEWPNTECASAAARLLPPIRAYMDFDAAIGDLEKVATELTPAEVSDTLVKMGQMAFSSGAALSDLPALFERVGSALGSPVDRVAGRWASLFGLPIEQAVIEATPEELQTLCEVRFAHQLPMNWLLYTECLHLASEIAAKLHAGARAAFWLQMADLARHEGDKDAMRGYMAQAKDCFLRFDDGERAVVTAGHIATLSADVLGDPQTAVEVLEYCLERWPDNFRADAAVYVLIRAYEGVGDEQKALACCRRLLTEFRDQKHSQICRPWLEMRVAEAGERHAHCAAGAAAQKQGG